MSDKTPDILIPALRQYQHNDCSGLLAGFDYDDTVKIVSALQQSFIEQAETIANECSFNSSTHRMPDVRTAYSVGIDDFMQAIREKFSE